MFVFTFIAKDNLLLNDVFVTA